ncbi:MAG: type II toxin-antitoxin system VapC family toxin [Chloroflexi bacterium]|nr:type II toxin-antitoxin system VapC family toxin [Chloroflexota bacterium]
MEQGTPLVLELMERDREWVASALTYAETEITFCHLGYDGRMQAQTRGRLADDWERFRVVPVDGRCLARASEIGCAHDVRTLDAIHLAAADRLPRPLAFLTFDRRQAAAAREMDIDVTGDDPAEV